MTLIFPVLRYAMRVQLSADDFFRKGLFAYGLLVALCFGGTVRASSMDEDREPVFRVDIGWEVGTPAGGGWLPDYASNLSGTFLRSGDRLFFFEGLSEESWQSLKNSFYYGGVLSAGALTATYMALIGVDALGLMVPEQYPQYLGYSVGLVSKLYAWSWQLKNIYTNGYASGRWYLGAHFLGGLDSYRGPESRRDQYIHDRLHILVSMMSAWVVDNARGVMSKRMISTADIKMPACLADQMFVDIVEQDSVSGDATLRIHRVPRVLRGEKRDHYPSGCTSWRKLLKTMDRDRIDRLIIKPRLHNGKAELLVEFSDHRRRTTGQLQMKLNSKNEKTPWVEHFLAEDFSRRDADELRTVLHPAYITMIRQALDCYTSLPDDGDVATCKQGTLYQVDSGGRHLNWTTSTPSEVTSWSQETSGKTLFYFDYPQFETPYLSWEDSYGGPSLELHDGSGSEPSLISQYRFSERVSHALSGELDYLMRYIPHTLIGYYFIPGIKNLFNSSYSLVGRRIPFKTSPDMDDIESMCLEYTPGWLNNVETVAQPFSRYFSSPGIPMNCATCSGSM